MAQGAVEFGQLTRSRGIGGGGKRRRYLIDIEGRLLSRRAPYVVNVLVMHYGEEPSAEISAHLPEMSLIQPAKERVLYEIIRPIAVPSERPRIATQSRDFMLDEAVKFAHRGDLRSCDCCRKNA